ncbi:MAG: hypothetical protein ABII89_03145 [Candidatus Omnitrophota bacterium]
MAGHDGGGIQKFDIKHALAYVNDDKKGGKMKRVISLTDAVLAEYLQEYFKRTLRAQRSSPIWKALKESGRLKLRPRGSSAKGRQTQTKPGDLESGIINGKKVD